MEESLYVSLLSQLQYPDPGTVSSALRSIKHRLIGHDQTKALFVQLGIAKLLVNILTDDDDSSRPDVWFDVKVEAGIIVGSLTYGPYPQTACSGNANVNRWFDLL